MTRGLTGPFDFLTQDQGAQDATAADIQLPSTEESATSSSSVSYDSAPPLAPGAEAAAVSSAPTRVVKGLQTAINRFYGVTIGSPITVDGAVGNETLQAVNSIIAWMPGAGYDTSAMATLIGDRPTAGSIAANAADLSNLIDWIASDNNFTQGPTTAPAPSVAAARAPSGLKVPAVHPRQLPQGQSQVATSFLGLGLPMWAFYAAGSALAIGVVALIIKHKRERGRGMAGFESAADLEEFDDDGYDD